MNKVIAPSTTNIIYRYLNWDKEKHRRSLTHSELYFAPPFKLNDPMDCKIGPDYAMLDTDAKRGEFIDRSVKHFTPQQFEKWQADPDSKSKHIALLRDFPGKSQEFFDLMWSGHVDQSIGVLCLSERWNSVTMWAHYAKNHTGFCLGFDEKKLTQLARGGSGPVIYKDEFPKIDPLAENPIIGAIELTHYKGADWSYEKEFRIAKAPDTSEDRIMNYPEECLKEIIVGLDIPGNYIQAIKTIAVQRNIPIFRIVKQRSFVFAREPIV